MILIKGFRPLDLKTVIKWVLAPLISTKLNCSSNSSDDFLINLFFSNDEDNLQVFEPFREKIDEAMGKFNNKRNKKFKKKRKEEIPVSFTQHTFGIISKVTKYSN